MGLSGLNTALTGLSIAQRQIDVISNNIANVGTEGYTRKILPQYAQSIDGKGVGVLASTLIRNVDLNLSRTLWTQVSTVSANSIQVEYLEKIEQFHGPADSEISVASYISDLHDSFAALSDDPSSQLLLSSTVNQAVDTANKINEFSDYITTLRNDAQNEIYSTVQQINNLLEQIAEVNEEIVSSGNIGKSTAMAEDLRDGAVKELAELIDITFFIQGDGTMVVQTNRGAEMTGRTAHELFFDPTPLAADIFYPDSAAGVYLDDPLTEPSSIDLTDLNPGGKLGGLITLRDETFPKQMAQLDELSHKLATRFEAQGLLLFVDGTGTVPADSAPDVSVEPEIAVPYVGFSSQIRVNEAIINDSSLLQSGTETTGSVETGSNVVINRILEYTFGSISYQEAVGATDLRVSGNAAPDNTLQEFLGLRSSNTVTGTRDLSSYADANTFIAATNGSIDATSNTFRITLEEPDLGLGPINIDVDLSAVQAFGSSGNLAQDIVDYIETDYYVNTLTPAEQITYDSLNVDFSVSSNGQIVIDTTGNITLDATSPANPMGASNLALLGFAEGTTEATDPYFDIAVGNNDYTRITLEPADDETSLLAKLQAVPGLAVEDITLSADGYLRLRPGNDYDEPEFGGAISIVSGAFTANNASANTLVGAGTVPDGVNIVSALFGSFDAGPPAQSLSPIANVDYGSEVSSTDLSALGFREDLLGPNADISTNIVASTSLLDFAQKMINEHSQELLALQDQLSDNETFLDLLQDQLLNESGVNTDEELSHLIVVQTAYSASARVVNAVEELFDELLAIF